ncbi:MAG: PEP-CTERM sorting domain-containing protein [Pirellulaceae bacterium]
MKIIFPTILTLICAISSHVSRADLVVTGHEVLFSIVEMGADLNAAATWNESYLDGAYGHFDFSGVDSNNLSAGDSLLAYARFDQFAPSYSQWITFSVTNNGVNSQSIFINGDGYFHFGFVFENMPRTLTANGLIFWETEHGGVEYFDNYSRTETGLGFGQSVEWPHNYLQEAVIPPGESLEWSVFLNGDGVGDFTSTAVPEPTSLLTAGLAIAGILSLRRPRRLNR